MLITSTSITTKWLNNTLPCLCKHLHSTSSTITSSTNTISRSFSSTTSNTRLHSTSTNSTSNLWNIRKNNNGNKRSLNQRNFHSSNKLLVKDPYSVLGVGKDASTSEIKKTYYQLAKKFHPDSNKEKSAKEKFMEIQDAYDVLSDDKKRADFDRYGAASQQQGFDSDAYARATSSFGGGFGGFGDFGGGGGQQQGSDIFESLFGSFGRGSQARSGQTNFVGEDIEVMINLPFLEAAKGTTKVIEITPVVECQTCTGTGMKEGIKKTSCKSCGGSGTRTYTIQSGFQMASTCNACNGSGTTVPPGSGCDSCAGVGKVRERKSVDVDVPAGVDQGMRIKYGGKGDAPIGGKGRTGDLYIRVNVLPSKTFRRQGINLYQDISIPFYHAILGGQTKVNTLDDQVLIKIPRGTQPGQEIIMKGKGIKVLNKNDFGDLVVRFNVSIPRDLTSEQKRILQEFVDETESPAASRYSPTGTPSSSSSSETTGRETKKWWETLEPESTTSTDTPPPPSSSSSTPPPPPPPPSSSSTTSTPSSKSKSNSTSTPPPPPPAPSSPESTSTPVEPVLEKNKTEEAKGKAEGEEDHTVLGDLWKGIRNRLPKK